MEDDDEFFKQGNNSSSVVNTTFDDEEALVLRDILQLHAANFSSESESTRSPQTDNNNNYAIATAAEAEGGTGSSTLSYDDSAAAIGVGGGFNDYNNNNNRKRCRILSKSSSSNSIESQQQDQVPSEKSYILSFDDYCNGTDGRKQQGGGGRGRSSWRSGANQSGANSNNNKKVRNSSESLDHILAERKRRQELTERFIALSATIPGLKKIDKASILSEAIKYVKELQERVKKLEEKSCSRKVKVESVCFFNSNKASSSSSSGSEEGSASSKSNNSSSSSEEECHRLIMIPEVEARALEKQVLVRIHCKKHSGVMLKIFTHLITLDLSVLSNSVLPFGDSALDITIIAQMGEKYKGGSVKELVKSLRMSLSESPHDIQQQQQQQRS